jgi:hypothetical protein
MEKRKPRKKLAKQKEYQNKLEPFDFSKIGTTEDPCFGKHYDAKAPECTRCGDSELCIIALSQNAHVQRDKLEQKNTFKDIENDLEPEKDAVVIIPKLIKRYVAKGYMFKKCFRLVQKKFPDAEEAFVKRIYKNHKS